MKLRKLFIFTLLIFLITGCTTSSAQKDEVPKISITAGIEEAEEENGSVGMLLGSNADNEKIDEDYDFGGIYIDITPEQMSEAGFEYGDGVTVEFSNGYVMENIPYYSGYFGKTGEMALIYYQGYPSIKACICQGESLWDVSGCSDEDTATITLVEQGEYLDIQNALNMTYSNELETYPSIEAFANFRGMKGGKMENNLFYRGTSPDDNTYLRAPIVDQFLKDYKIQYILNLADTVEKVEINLNKDDFDSPYFLSLYEEGNVYLVGLGSNYRDDTYKEKLVAGLQDLITHEGPYYIHCQEGKDRTGFVCILIECIGGCSEEEIEADYMKTYENYYGITTSDKEKYAAVLDVKFDDMICWLEGVEDHDDLKNVDLEKGAKDYLLSGGMSESEYQQLKKIITGSYDDSGIVK